MQTLNLGSVRFNGRGVFIPEESYKILDTVSYGGNSYFCIKPVTTENTLTPTDEGAEEFWQVLISKLDISDSQVVSSTGTQSLTDALDQRGPVFDNVADMKAAEGLTVGIKCRTLGYYSPGDGGGCDYEIVAAGSGTDDGGSYIDLTGSGLQAKGLFGESASVTQFGAIGDGVTDDWPAISAAFQHSRAAKAKITAPAETYSISQSLDISGIDFEGRSKNFAGNDGTKFVFGGDTDGLAQESVSAANINYSIKKLRVENALAALKMTYATFCTVEDFYVRDSQDGILCGDPTIFGTLWNTFTRCDVRVSRYALVVDGEDFSNANKFDTCYFAGGERSGYVNAGGLGAIANHFSNVEFAGGKLGIELGRNKSTYMENCYHESRGPAIKISGFTLGLDINNPVFALLRNDNDVGINSFIWHESFVCRMRLSGGYVVLPSGVTTSGLSLIRSDNEGSFFLDMQSAPNTEISASGWSLFHGSLPTRNDTLTYRSSYTPSISSVSGTFTLGTDGSAEGYYHISGRTATVNVEVRIGSDTVTTGTQFLFGLPFRNSPSAFRSHGSAVISRLGAENFLGVAQVNASSSQCSIFLDNSVTAVGNNSPRAWQEGDRIRFTITYTMG